MTKPLDEAKQKIMDFFKGPLDKLARVEGNIKNAMLTFQREQEEIRRKMEARIQELARREEERRRKALEEKAKKADEKGDVEKAEDLRQQKEEVFVPAPIVESQVTKVAGISTKKVWRFKIIDASKIERQWMVPDEKAIQAYVTATKGTRPIPGLEIYSEDVLSSGRAQ
jgi:ATPase subunit of ABC transporter with duplicated ATPase domains